MMRRRDQWNTQKYKFQNLLFVKDISFKAILREGEGGNLSTRLYFKGSDVSTFFVDMKYFDLSISICRNILLHRLAIRKLYGKKKLMGNNFGERLS